MFVDSYHDYYDLDFLRQGKPWMYPERGKVLQDIVNRISKIKPTGRLCDLGSGDGQFLARAEQRGYQTTGVEESASLAAFARTKLRGDVIQGRYDHSMFAPSSFDIMTMIQVLEHVADPVQTLQTIKTHLRRRGLLVFEVPSIHSPHFLAYRMTGIHQFVRPPHGIIDCHIGYYTPSTLLKLTTRAGFETLGLVTGRWRFKYQGWLGAIGAILDPFFQMTKIGGILYIGRKK